MDTWSDTYSFENSNRASSMVKALKLSFPRQVFDVRISPSNIGLVQATVDGCDNVHAFCAGFEAAFAEGA